MSNKNERMPLDLTLCLGQFTQTFNFVCAMQQLENIEGIAMEAEHMCEVLFQGVWSAEHRAERLTALAYLTLNLAANISYTIDRAKLYQDMYFSTGDLEEGEE